MSSINASSSSSMLRRLGRSSPPRLGRKLLVAGPSGPGAACLGTGEPNVAAEVGCERGPQETQGGDACVVVVRVLCDDGGARTYAHARFVGTALTSRVAQHRAVVGRAPLAGAAITTATATAVAAATTPPAIAPTITAPWSLHVGHSGRRANAPWTRTHDAGAERRGAGRGAWATRAPRVSHTTAHTTTRPGAPRATTTTTTQARIRCHAVASAAVCVRTRSAKRRARGPGTRPRGLASAAAAAGTAAAAERGRGGRWRDEATGVHTAAPCRRDSGPCATHRWTLGPVVALEPRLSRLGDAGRVASPRPSAHAGASTFSRRHTRCNAGGLLRRPVHVIHAAGADTHVLLDAQQPQRVVLHRSASRVVGWTHTAARGKGGRHASV